jgi:recombination protein RecR
MQYYPLPIQNLIECYKKLPTIGEKTAERLALATLDLDQDIVDLFSATLSDIKNKVKRCKICNNYTDEDYCLVCKNDRRNKKIICVVEEPKNIILFEKLNSFQGVYHVLDGLISPIDGITPDDINLSSLLERIKNDNVEEIILALKPSLEGETTSLYIIKCLENVKIKISKIAQGIPIGADIDYVDALTLESAFENRKYVDNSNS